MKITTKPEEFTNEYGKVIKFDKTELVFDNGIKFRIKSKKQDLEVIKLMCDMEGIQFEQN